MLWNELLFKYFYDNKKKILPYIIITLIIFPLESIALPKLYTRFFESIKSYNLPDLFSDIMNNIFKLSSTGLIWIIIFIWIILIFLKFINNYYDGDITASYLSYIREKIFSNTINSFSTNYTDLNGGKYITRLLDLSRYLRDIFTNILTDIFPLFIAILTVIIYFLYSDLKIGLIMICGITISSFIAYFMGIKCINDATKREKYYFDMIGKISDSFENIMHIYLNNEESKEIEKNNKLNDYNANLQSKQLIYTQKIATTITIISTITFFTIIIFNYNRLVNKVIKPTYFVSVFVIILYYFSYLLKFSNHLPWNFVKIGVIKSSEDIINNIFSNNSDNLDTSFVIKNGDIEFKNIYFKYPKSNSYILEDVNLLIKGKEKICLIGPSGAGKSTLVKLLLRMNFYNQGNIFIDNKNIKNIPISYLRNKIIYLNQRTSLFNTSIFNNILYGNPDLSKKEIVDIIKKYEITNFNTLKNGLEENTGVNGANLSLGMQKITIILRGIFKKDASIIIFDEPLAGLDSNTRSKIIKIIENECKNKTIIIITHDKEILPFCSKIINIKDLKNK